MDLVTLIGIVGTATILIAFILNQNGFWCDTDLKYDVANVIGSVILVIYSYMLKSYPFIILNTVWALVSIRDTIKIWKSK